MSPQECLNLKVPLILRLKSHNLPSGPANALGGWVPNLPCSSVSLSINEAIIMFYLAVPLTGSSKRHLMSRLWEASAPTGARMVTPLHSTWIPLVPVERLLQAYYCEIRNEASISS